MCRTILSHIFGSFTFELAGGTKEASDSAPVGSVSAAVKSGEGNRHLTMGINRGTMGPRDYDANGLQQQPGISGNRAATGLKVRAIPR